MTEKLLIIGKTPPPVGGVRIHVKRLTESLKKDGFDFLFYDLSKFKLIQIIQKIREHKTIHLHTSNPSFRFFISAFCRFSRKIIIVTFHGNLGRYNKIKNFFDILTVKLANYPVVLNDQSLEKAIRINKNTRKIPAFIPPLKINQMNEKMKFDIISFSRNFECIFCTNAFNISFDKDGNEIYGISMLVEIFLHYPEFGLIFSDPSGKYSLYLEEKGISLPKNIKVIAVNHDFVEILKISDIYIRNTTTDGDSLSIKEALFFEKKVLTTDCVDRPEGCYIYKTLDKENIMRLIHSISCKETDHKIIPLNGYPMLKKLYLNSLNKNY